MSKRMSVALLLLAAFPAPALAETAEVAMVRAFLDELDARAHWSASAASIRAEGGSTVAEGILIAEGEDGPRIGIGRMVADGLGARPGGGFVASAIRLEGIAAESGPFTATIPLVDGEVFALPNLVAIPFDPDAPLTFVAELYSALATAEIGRLDVPEFVLTQAGATPGEPESELRYANLTLADLRGGVVQALDAGPVVSEARTADGVVRTELDSFETRMIGIGAMAHLLDPGRYEGGRGDGVWRPALGSIHYAGIRVGGAVESTLTIGRVALGNVDVRQPEKPFAPMIEQLAGDDEMTEEQALALAREYLPGLLHSFRIGEVRIEDLAVAEAGEQAEAAFAGGIQRFTVTGISAVGIDTISLLGLNMADPQARVGLDGFEMAGLVFPELEAFLTLAEQEEAGDEADIEERIGELISGLIPKIGRAGFDGLSIMAEGVGPITVDRYLAEVGTYIGAVPVTSRMALTGLTIPSSVLQADADAAALFNGLGIDSLTFDLSGDSDYAADGGSYAAELLLTARDLSSLHFRAEVLGVTERWLERYMAAAPVVSVEEALMLFGELRLSGLALELKDDTLVERVLGFLAQQEGVGTEAYRAEIGFAVPMFLTMVADPILRADIADAVRAFLQGGRSLTLTLEPPRPLAIADIVATAQIQPEGLPTLLGPSLRASD